MVEKTINFRTDPSEAFPPIMTVNGKLCDDPKEILEHIGTKLQDITEHKDKVATLFEQQLNDNQKLLRESNKAKIEQEMKQILVEGPLLEAFTSREISKSEVNKSRAAQQTNKSPGEDTISNEMLKYGGHKMESLLHAFFNLMWKSEMVPENIQRAILIVIHKKGAKTDIGNYRPITLASAILKTYEKVIGNRITEHINSITDNDGHIKLHNAQGDVSLRQGLL